MSLGGKGGGSFLHGHCTALWIKLGQTSFCLHLYCFVRSETTRLPNQLLSHFPTRDQSKGDAPDENQTQNQIMLQQRIWRPIQ